MTCKHLAVLKRWYESTDHLVRFVLFRILGGLVIGAILGLGTGFLGTRTVSKSAACPLPRSHLSK